MLTNFENITCHLSEDEKELVPIIIQGLSNKTKDNPIKGAEICKKLNNKGYKITEARLRKITNFIRAESIIPIIATSNGYYCSYDKDEIKKQIQSLIERADAIMVSANGLKHFI